MKEKLPKNRRIRIGEGKDCPKCKIPMERRKHFEVPKNRVYYFREWDFCLKCKHLQHYEEFKCSTWQEIDRQDKFINEINGTTSFL